MMSDRFGTTALLHKEIANISNEQKRHCRIGKVHPKYRPQPVIPAMPYVGDFPHYPPATPSIWTPNTAHPIVWWQNPVISTC